ncbi:uncharacterized protein LOC141904063 [Tubulanus polymorphus]|uniref:uncharacterized protein LOC141904063 n=1 Tax=Tubulanus polymorphus TaxID=672921 RepID=UPI003DA3A5AB
MAQKVADGITKEILRAGSGDKPKVGQKITVHCTGSLSGNPPKKFWSTRDPGQKEFTFKVGLNEVIEGWDVGCLTMQKGELAKLTIRGDKAYGSRGFRAWGIGPNAELIFEIEMLRFE